MGSANMSGGSEMTSGQMVTIPEMFAGQHVLVTGGSGFMGKVLLEKLLRSCPDIARIYVVLRSKRGRSAEDRLNDIVETPLFEPLRGKRPNDLKKLVAVPGDCSELGLGISPQDTDIITENVSIVFHVAATVKFDDPLKSALLLNTRGTQEVVNLARKMKKLKVLQHVSTTYCWTNQPTTEEKVYPADIDWRTLIRLAEREDQLTLDGISRKILGFQPNTYTFTKSMAEQVINDARDELPVLIYRPPVVISSLKDPIPGWIDNLNGPFGIWAAAAKGVLRYSLGDPAVALSMCPVDWAIRGMITSAWAFASGLRLSNEKGSVEVLNQHTHHVDRSTFGDQQLNSKKVIQYMPTPIRHLKYTITTNYWYYYLGVIWDHILFALFADALIYISGNKPRLLSTYRKILVANDALRFFMLNEFKVSTNNFRKLEIIMKPEDYDSFSMEINKGGMTYDNLEYSKATLIGIAKYCFKENDIDPKKGKQMQFWLWVAEMTWYAVLVFLVYWVWCPARGTLCPFRAGSLAMP